MGRVTVAGGKPAMRIPIVSIPAGDLAVGSSVYLMENGVATEYLVVNQGKPSGSSLYDDSCDGTWLLRKHVDETRQWHSSGVTDYANSTIHSYLNNTFFNLFGTVEKETIKQVKIPYCSGSEGITIASGSDGLATTAFLLGGYEVGFTYSWLTPQSHVVQDGAKLEYFTETVYASDEKIALLGGVDGSYVFWYLRSPQRGSGTDLICVAASGAMAYGDVTPTTARGVRPAVIIPSNALVDENTLLLKGVA